jgi:hypothetical protein
MSVNCVMSITLTDFLLFMNYFINCLINNDRKIVSNYYRKSFKCQVMILFLKGNELGHFCEKKTNFCKQSFF